jgi:hypothetical protein
MQSRTKKITNRHTCKNLWVAKYKLIKMPLLGFGVFQVTDAAACERNVIAAIAAANLYQFFVFISLFHVALQLCAAQIGPHASAWSLAVKTARKY